MPNVIAIIFWGLVMIGIIVFVHEGGHFIAARLMRIRVREFMFGLPGPSIGFKIKKTRYGVTAIPLGGYCLIAGEGGEENPNLAQAYAYLSYWGTLTYEQAEKSSDSLDFDLVEALDSLESWMTIATIKPRRKSRIHEKRYEMLAATIDGVDYPQGAPRPVADLEAAQAHIDAERLHTYAGMPWWRRVVVLLGGSVFNLLFAIIVITSVLLIVGDVAPTTTIGSIVEGSPAAQAGLVAGDVLKSIDGVECATWEDFTQAIAAHEVGETVRIRYLHAGAERSALITLADNKGSPMVGVTTQLERVPMAITKALRMSVGLIGQAGKIILQLFNPATFSETVSQSSSVVGIAVEAERAASAGLMQFIVLSAVLSISIGLMNLLPVPPLDGGKIIIETIQRLTRRIVPVRIINGISIAALLLLALLFIVVTNQDIHRYFLGG